MEAEKTGIDNTLYYKALCRPGASVLFHGQKNIAQVIIGIEFAHCSICRVSISLRLFIAVWKLFQAQLRT